MALSNSERQARWRARLKEKAERNARVEDAFRQHMRTFLLDAKRFVDCASEAELEIRLAAVDAMLAASDEKLAQLLNALIDAWYDDECVARSRAQRAGAKAPRRE